MRPTARPEVVVPNQTSQMMATWRGLIYFLVISLQLFDACDMLEYYVMDTISCA
jgi:hypothetical protein